MPEIDWGVAAGAAGLFIANALMAYKAWKDKKTEDSSSGVTVVGGMLQDNVTMRHYAKATEDLHDEVKDLRSDIRENTHALNNMAQRMERLAALFLVTRSRD